MLLTVATLEKTYASLRVPVPWIPQESTRRPQTDHGETPKKAL